MGFLDKLKFGGKAQIDDDIVREVMSGKFLKARIDTVRVGEGDGGEMFILSELVDPFQAGFVGLLLPIAQQFKGDAKLGLVHGGKKNCVVFRGATFRGLLKRGSEIKNWGDMKRGLAALGCTLAQSDSSLFR